MRASCRTVEITLRWNRPSDLPRRVVQQHESVDVQHSSSLSTKPSRVEGKTCCTAHDTDYAVWYSAGRFLACEHAHTARTHDERHCSISDPAGWGRPRRRRCFSASALGCLSADGMGGRVASRCFVTAAMGSAWNCGLARTACSRPASFALHRVTDTQSRIKRHQRCSHAALQTQSHAASARPNW